MTNDHRHDTLRDLSADLRDVVSVVDDPDLRAQIFDWLQRSTRLPDGDVAERVENHLSELRGRDDAVARYAMRRTDGDGSENFPDSCEGCPHYGVRCPVFVDPTEVERRNRIPDRHDDEPSIRQAYRQFATHNGCHQISEALDAWHRDYRDLVEEGLSLYEDSSVPSTAPVDESEAARQAVEETLGGRP